MQKLGETYNEIEIKFIGTSIGGLFFFGFFFCIVCFCFFVVVFFVIIYVYTFSSECVILSSCLLLEVVFKDSPYIAWLLS